MAYLHKLMECNDVFTNEMISNALYGLQGMTSGDSDMDLLLPLLTKKIKDSKYSLQFNIIVVRDVSIARTSSSSLFKLCKPYIAELI